MKYFEKLDREVKKRAATYFSQNVIVDKNGKVRYENVPDGMTPFSAIMMKHRKLITRIIWDSQ